MAYVDSVCQELAFMDAVEGPDSVAEATAAARDRLRTRRPELADEAIAAIISFYAWNIR